MRGSRLLVCRRLAVLALLLLAVPVLAADPASVTCEIRENGQPGSGTIVVLQGATEVGRGSCGKPITLPTGDFTAVLSLDGALDGPEQRQSFSTQANKNAKVTADFATGLLEVRIRSQGRDTAGMAVIRKAGQQIGTLGSGVAAHLSVGSYQVVARYRTQQKPYDGVQIKQGERTLLEASFE
jgi:hypothetical protein